MKLTGEGAVKLIDVTWEPVVYQPTEEDLTNEKKSKDIAEFFYNKRKELGNKEYNRWLELRKINRKIAVEKEIANQPVKYKKMF